MADLWLNYVKRTGHGPDGDTTLPHVFFDGYLLENLVDPQPGQDESRHWRLFAVRNELGGRIDVEYGHATDRACDAAYVAGRDEFASTKECFAVPTGDGTAADPDFEWHHKYVVKRIAASDDAMHYRYQQATTGAPLGRVQITDYEYTGAPAWRFEDSRNIPGWDESWTDWRGYEQTYVHARKVGADQLVATGDESITRVVRFRGMDNTRASRTPPRWSPTGV